MSSVNIKVEVLAAGQPRPYADTVHSYRFTFERGSGDGWCTRPGEEFVNRLAQQFMGARPVKRKDDEREWWETYRSRLSEVEPGVWEVAYITPFTD